MAIVIRAFRARTTAKSLQQRNAYCIGAAIGLCSVRRCPVRARLSNRKRHLRDVGKTASYSTRAEISAFPWFPLVSLKHDDISINDDDNKSTKTVERIPMRNVPQ